MFHWQLEQLQEWSLRLLYWDYISHFQDFLENTSSKSILTTRNKLILVEVFKSGPFKNSEERDQSKSGLDSHNEFTYQI